jgi:asparagine synthase (glutamine-hydrolysing)
VSAFAGCYWFDERPACPDDLQIPTRAAVHRARGPFHIWCSGPVALAYGDDERRTVQPTYDPPSRTAVIVDGPIDNLAEVARTLGASTNAPSEVVRAAYQRWGLDAGAHLIGDFLLVIYDEREKRLVCIRDPMGQRPLFYGVGSRGVVMGSELQQVVRHPAIPGDINEGMIAEYVTNLPVSVTETVWQAVQRLPPAHALTVADHNVSIRRFWDFDPDKRVEHATANDYDEEFRELFTRTVDCRVRDSAGVGVLLSGGIDSSAVASMAQSIRAQLATSPVHALSIAFPGRACDETAYVETVVDKWQLPWTRRDVVLPSRDALEREAERYLDLPMYPNSLVAAPLRAEAAALGLDVLLTGCGGDEFFAGSPMYPLDLVREGHVFAGARALVRPYLSAGARRLLKPIFGARPTQRPWLRAEFAARVDLGERCRPAVLPTFPTEEQRELYRLVNGSLQVLSAELEDRAAQAVGLVVRHPLFDRRVAEFGLALPSSERWQGREMKVLLRRALRDYLPSTVGARNDKAEFSSTYADTIEAIGGRTLFSRLKSHDNGWVDQTVIGDMYDRMIALYRRGDEAYIGWTGPLFVVAALEMWLDRCPPPPLASARQAQ